MRPIFALFAVLALGCSESSDDRVPALEARLSALEAAVGAIPVPVDPTVAIRSMEERIAAVEAAVAFFSAPKTPHLLALAGTPDEYDLGPWYDFGHAYSAEFGGYYSTKGGTGYRYATDDCTGEPFTGASPRDGAVLSPDGKIVLPGVEDFDVKILSQWSTGRPPGSCELRQPAVERVRRPFDTGFTAPFFPESVLSVDLR